MIFYDRNFGKVVTFVVFNIAPKAVQISHMLLENIVFEGDTVIDATVGNGHDTLFLAELVGSSGKVFGFDIQDLSIKNTEARLNQAGVRQRVTLINEGHENLDKFVHGSVKAVVFNLGYLPGGDHSVITKSDTTLVALEKSIEVLSPGGVVCLVIYWGHSGGADEKAAIEQYVSTLSQVHWNVAKLTFPNKLNNAPFIIAVQKRYLEVNK